MLPSGVVELDASRNALAGLSPETFRAPIENPHRRDARGIHVNLSRNRLAAAGVAAGPLIDA